MRKAEIVAVLRHERAELLAGMRSLLIHPYILFYRVEADTVEIVRILHGRRDVASIFANSPVFKKRSDT
jgi:toxin ParE1/3/4